MKKIILGLALLVAASVHAAGVGVSGSGVGGVPSRLKSTNIAVTSTASENILTLTNTGSFGSCVRLLGNGATTPGKSLCAYNGNLDIWNSAETAVSFRIQDNGTITSMKACAAGHIRVGPNLCMKQSALTAANIVRDTLTTLTDPSTDSKALIVFTAVAARSGNAVALRTTDLLFYSNSILQQTKRSYSYEHVAVAAGNVLDIQDGLTVIVKNTNYQVQFSDDTANQGTVDLEIRGYYD